MLLYRCLLPRLISGGLNLFYMNNDLIMIDDGHLDGWPRMELNQPIEPRHMLNDEALERFNPAVGLDRFGFTGERMAGRIILFNFERTRGWERCGPWLEKLKQEIIRRVTEFNSDCSPVFYLYDWTDMIETGDRLAQKHIDGRFIPVNADKPLRGWISRYRDAIRVYGDIPMLHPNDFNMVQCELALAAFAHWAPSFAVWAVSEPGFLAATERKCEDLLHCYKQLKGVV